MVLKGLSCGLVSFMGLVFIFGQIAKIYHILLIKFFCFFLTLIYFCCYQRGMAAKSRKSNLFVSV